MYTFPSRTNWYWEIIK